MVLSLQITTLICMVYGSGWFANAVKTPDLIIHPRPTNEDKGSRLLWFEGMKREDWRPLVEDMNNFLNRGYLKVQQYSGIGGRFTRCDWDSRSEPHQNCFVRVGKTALSEQCSKKLNFGYDRGTPCFIIHLENVPGWIPHPFTRHDLESADFKDKLPNDIRKMLTRFDLRHSYVWIVCNGETAADKEFLGPIKYSPWMGFPTYYFPYQNQTNYLSPFVTLQFARPTMGVVINVVCRALAKNIQEPMGTTHFQLLID